MTRPLEHLVPRVARALLRRGVPEAFARYQEAAELLRSTVDVGDLAEQKDVEVLDSPRVARAQRYADRFRASLQRARERLDELLGENAKASHAGSSVRLGVALRMAPDYVVAKAQELASEDRARGLELVPSRPGASDMEDDDETPLDDPAPDPRLEKKDCSCGRRVRAYLFDEHTRTCSSVDRSPIVDREALEPEEEDVPKKIDADPAKIAAMKATGKTNAEIASELGISKASVTRRLSPSTIAPPQSSPPSPADPSPAAARAPAPRSEAKDIDALRSCVALIEPLPEVQRRAVVYYLGARFR